jgi:heme-degrading monooxygenase HmoA
VSEPVPPLVTLHVWRVRSPARALLRMATDRRTARRTPGVRFAKLMGTGDGRTFTVRDSDPHRWALLTTWSDAAAADAFDTSPVGRGWSSLAEETWRLDLRPLVSTGRWSRREPFGAPVPQRHDGPVAAVTRARLTPTRAARFWSAVPPVSAELHRQPGLRAALGIGEAPIGLQGTFSLWSSADALRDFAHRSPAHQAVVARTPVERWYSEELFARFAVLGSSGTLDGADPLA